MWMPLRPHFPHRATPIAGWLMMKNSMKMIWRYPRCPPIFSRRPTCSHQSSIEFGGTFIWFNLFSSNVDQHFFLFYFIMMRWNRGSTSAFAESLSTDRKPFGTALAWGGTLARREVGPAGTGVCPNHGFLVIFIVWPCSSYMILQNFAVDDV